MTRKETKNWSDYLLVTVFSDASLKDGVVGAGFWIKSQHVGNGLAYSVSVGGCARWNSSEAELWGIVCAVRKASELHEGIVFDLVLQCDNLTALGAVSTLGHAFARSSKLTQSRKHSRLSEVEKQLLKEFASLPGIRKVWLKHVKGHSSGCHRTCINNLTDKLAAKARKRLS